MGYETGCGDLVQGLGEMMPEQLWSTTLDPSTRVLRRLTLGDAAQAAQLFSVLMGSQVGGVPASPDVLHAPQHRAAHTCAIESSQGQSCPGACMAASDCTGISRD